MSEHIYFMVEGGRALKLVKENIADARRVNREVIKLVKELGAPHYRISTYDGRLTRVLFEGHAHPDFKKDKDGFFPKKGTEWAQRFAAQKGHRPSAQVIEEAFDIPFQICYSHNGGTGLRRIGYLFNECGFLYPHQDGPYGMFVTDVPAAVAEDIAKGYTVAEPALSFKMEFDGARRIEKEEWDIVVATHALAIKRAAAKKSA